MGNACGWDGSLGQARDGLADAMRKVPGSCNLEYQVVQPDPNSLNRPKFVKLAMLRCCIVVLY